MLKSISITFLLLSLANCSATGSRSIQQGKTPRGNSSDGNAAVSLSYCDLLKTPKLYVGKQVRIRASWQFGFETSFVYDRECPLLPKAWLEFVNDDEACPQTKQNRSLPTQSDKEAEVTVVGKLYGPGRHGHLGDYEYKFVVTCLEKLEVTSSDIK